MDSDAYNDKGQIQRWLVRRSYIFDARLTKSSFVNWGIYARKYPPSAIPTSDLTHLLYAFANISPDTGTVSLSDQWADEQIHYEGDSWNDPDANKKSALHPPFSAHY